MSVKKKAVFFDRDGVLLKLVYDKELGVVYTPRRANQVIPMPRAKNVLLAAKRLGFINVIASNQPDIGLDRMTMATFKEIQQRMHKLLNPKRNLIDGEYYCLHHPFAIQSTYKKQCSCRKPEPGLLRQAAKDLDIDLKKSWNLSD